MDELYIVWRGHCLLFELWVFGDTSEQIIFNVPTLEPNIVKHQSDYQILILGIVW